MRSVVLAWMLVAACTVDSYANDYFVVTGTFSSQRDAQERAASMGGWALDTDSYSTLAPGLFAVVRGPFSTRELAAHKLAELGGTGSYPGAYVKDAGTLQLPANLAGAVSPSVVAALLGELSITTQDMPGGANPCEPQEPYQRVSVTRVTLDRAPDPMADPGGTTPRRVEIDLGGFWVLKRTGEIDRMRICLE